MIPNLNYIILCNVLWERSQYKLKGGLHPNIIEVAKTMDTFAEKYNTNIIYCDQQNALRNYGQVLAMIGKNTLTWSIASPNLHLFKLTTDREYTYVKDNPRFNLWKNGPVDPNIWNHVASLQNQKYKQPSVFPQVPDSYDLYVLQDIVLEEQYLRNSLLYCNEKKRPTVYKNHPASALLYRTHLQNNVWQKMREEGLITEYVTILETANLDHLIEKSDRVYSVNSVVSLNGLLAGKITAQFKDNDFTEITPQISDVHELDNVKAVDRSDIGRFLTWYFMKLCTDSNDPNYKDKVENIIIEYMSGKTTKELYA